MTATMLPTELGAEAAAAIGDIARRIADSRVMPAIVADDMSSKWTAIAAGGWDSVGVRDGDDGATLLDLVTIAQAWGYYALPLPFLTTVMAKRWSSAAAEHEGPVTFSAGGLVPFASVPQIQLATDLTGGGTLLPVEARSDDLAATLDLGRSSVVSQLSAESAHELAVVWAAEAVGAARRLLDEGVGYAKLREQFGKPIGSQQAIKHHLANAHLLLEKAETAVLWAANEPTDYARILDVAFRSCRDIGSISVQVHGGVGFTWELGLHFWVRHVLALTELAASLPR